MCSLSWFKTNQSITICFNRDEQKNRGIAIPPHIVSSNSHRVLMPIDSDAGGTWLTVNHFGNCICLLNLYTDKKNEETDFRIGDIKRSRGLLVKDLSEIANLESFSNKLNDMDLRMYSPFRLAFLSLCEQHQFVWNGKELRRKELPSFTSSTSYLHDKVLARRQEQFEQLPVITKESLISLHSKHPYGGDAYSICMHRDDAQTVSMSLVEITRQAVSYRYWDGSPCEQSDCSQQSLSIKANS